MRKIYLRIPTGWSKPVKNKGPYTCDIDGAKLWISPGSDIYCDLQHDPKTVRAVTRRKRK